MRVNVKEVKTENYVDATQKVLVDVWNQHAANVGLEEQRKRYGLSPHLCLLQYEWQIWLTCQTNCKIEKSSLTKFTCNTDTQGETGESWRPVHHFYGVHKNTSKNSLLLSRDSL